MMYNHTIKPSLFTKGSAAQKINQKQSYFDHVNLHCDLDFEASTTVFPHDTPSHDDAPTY